MRLWLVERATDSRDLVTLTYATTDGKHVYRRQAPLETLARNPVTAAIDRDWTDLEPVEASETRDRYATEAERMASTHAPDDEV